MLLTSQVLSQTRKIISGAIFRSARNNALGVIDIARKIKDEKHAGNAEIKGAIDKKSGCISGDLIFQNYCIGGAITSGEVCFYMKINATWEGVEFLRFNFENVATTSEQTAISSDGKIFVKESDTAAIVTMNTYITDIRASRTYWTDNYVGTATANGNKTNVNLHGNFYSPGYGYVEIATIKPFVAAGQTMWSTSENISFEGLTRAGGGHAMALITAYSNGYEAWVDNDGDGRFEWISERLHWTS